MLSYYNETRMTRAGWRIKYSRQNNEQLLARLARNKYYFRLNIYWILIIDISSAITTHCVFRFYCYEKVECLFPKIFDTQFHYSRDISPILIVMTSIIIRGGKSVREEWILQRLALFYSRITKVTWIFTSSRGFVPNKFPRWLPCSLSRASFCNSNVGALVRSPGCLGIKLQSPKVTA